MTPQNPMHSGPKDLTAEALARRRAVIGVLGKGTAAVAALAPLSSNASRSHKLYNTILGKDCYCTVSGFQSAAISAVPAVTCAAYTPASFFTVAPDSNFVNLTNAFTTHDYDYTNVTIKTSETVILKAQGKGKDQSVAYDGPADFQAWLVSLLGTDFSSADVPLAQVKTFLATTSSTNSGRIIISSKLKMVKWKTSSSLAVYTAKNFPSDINFDSAFNSIFNSTDSRTLLEVLSDGTSGKRFFLAAYLSIGNSSLVLPTDITRAYVLANYNDRVADDSSSDEYAFFSALCSKSA